jgi:surface antigen
LVVSGDDGSSANPSSELYDPGTNSWTTTGDVNQPRENFGLVTLKNGNALMTGGTDSTASTDYGSAELYNPSAGQWTYTGNLNTSRRNPVVVRLKNGEVLAATGAHGPPDGNRFLFTAELYNPKTGQWSFTGSMDIARDGASRGVVLKNGQVLVLGGEGPWLTFSSQVDLYNPVTGTWSLTGSIAHGVSAPILIALKNGDALMAGGDSAGVTYSDAEIYNPATGAWAETAPMHFARAGASAVLLANGDVLVAGGSDANGEVLPSEIYDPKTGQWTVGASLSVEHNDGRMVALGKTTALMVGGYGQNGPTTAAEIYQNQPLVHGQWPGTAGPAAASANYSYPYADPPACTDGGACVPDQWNFYEGQCTSWVAYRLNQLNGIAFDNSYGGAGTWGSADNWGPHAQSLGIPVDAVPALGSIAWYASGHVAYVERVNSPTSVVVSEMNYDFDNGFRVRTITTSHGWPTAFIHLSDR